MELLVLSVILLVVIIELIGLSINKEALFNFYNTFPSVKIILIILHMEPVIINYNTNGKCPLCI